MKTLGAITDLFPQERVNMIISITHYITTAKNHNETVLDL